MITLFISRKELGLIIAIIGWLLTLLSLRLYWIKFSSILWVMFGLYLAFRGAWMIWDEFHGEPRGK
jgi:hypothetical protein